MIVINGKMHLHGCGVLASRLVRASLFSLNRVILRSTLLME